VAHESRRGVAMRLSHLHSRRYCPRGRVLSKAMVACASESPMSTRKPVVGERSTWVRPRLIIPELSHYSEQRGTTTAVRYKLRTSSTLNQISSDDRFKCFNGGDVGSW